MRSALAAAGFSLAGWVYLVAAPAAVPVPLGHRDVPSPLIWPAAAALTTLLLSRSQLASWETRALRPLWPHRLAIGAGASASNALVGAALAPAAGRIALLAWFFALQVLALGCSLLAGDLAWVPLTTLVLVAMFELAQDGSWLLRLVSDAGGAALGFSAASWVALALLSARGTPTS